MQPRTHAVLGATLARELFASASPLGERVRVGGVPYRVVGVMAPKGQFLGFDLDDAVYIPAARALELYNREGLMEVDVLYRVGGSAQAVAEGLRRVLIARHGAEDFTVTTQQQMLEVLGSVLDVLTLAVGSLGGVSLLVGGVGILTVMVIAVNERVAEVGVLRAIGAERSDVMRLFLGEATLLAGVRGLAGLVLGLGFVQALALALPALPRPAGPATAISSPCSASPLRPGRRASPPCRRCASTTAASASPPPAGAKRRSRNSAPRWPPVAGTWPRTTAC